MNTKQADKDDPPASEATQKQSGCQHHWVIDPPKGPKPGVEPTGPAGKGNQFQSPADCICPGFADCRGPVNGTEWLIAVEQKLETA